MPLQWLVTVLATTIIHEVMPYNGHAKGHLYGSMQEGHPCTSTMAVLVLGSTVIFFRCDMSITIPPEARQMPPQWCPAPAIKCACTFRRLPHKGRATGIKCGRGCCHHALAAIGVVHNWHTVIMLWMGHVKQGMISLCIQDAWRVPFNHGCSQTMTCNAFPD